MRLALGLSVRTGWAVAVVAGGDWKNPIVVARETIVLVEEKERFVFHRAAEVPLAEGQALVDQARREASRWASGVLKRLAGSHGVKLCAIVAKKGAMLPLGEIVAAHPRIHTAEGRFYRDVIASAAEGAGMRVKVIAPHDLDVKDARLTAVGKVVGKPWTVDWKAAVLGAWAVIR